MPCVVLMVFAVSLDIANRRMVHKAIKESGLNLNLSVKEKRHKLDRIPRNTIIINSVLFVVLTSMDLARFIEEPENKVLFLRTSGYLVIVVRNLIIARLAFQVRGLSNQQNFKKILRVP